MIFSDFAFYLYLAVCFLLFLACILFSHFTSIVKDLHFCLSDLCFTYLFIPVIQIGVSMTGKYFTPNFQTRYPSRRRIALIRTIHCYLVSFFVTCIFFSLLFLYQSFISRGTPSIAILLDSFFRFLCGAFLLVNLTLCMQNLLPKQVSENTSILSCLFVVFELIILLPIIDLHVGLELNLYFSWVFYGAPPWNYGAMIIWILGGFVYCLYQADRRDIL